MSLTAKQKRLLVKIQRGEPVSARDDWMSLVSMACEGTLDTRRAPNGQLEYLHQGTPVRVGP